MSTDLATFDPRLIELWRKAATEPVSITVASHAIAVQLRQRLYRLRKTLNAANHEVAPAANRVLLQLTKNPDGTATITATASDKLLDSALDAAGLSLPPAPDL